MGSGTLKIVGIFFIVLILLGCQKETLEDSIVKVGIYVPTSELNLLVDGFKKGLAEKGYKKGKNILYKDLVNRSQDNYEEFRHWILENKLDLIFTATTPATLKIKKTLKNANIPIVFALVGEPLKTGVVKDMKNPGGFLTGIQSKNASEKGFLWVHKIIPGLKRIYVPYNPQDAAIPVSLPVLRKIAYRYKVEIVLAEVSSDRDVYNALKQVPEDIQVIWQVPSPFWSPYNKDFIEAAISHRIPLKVYSSGSLRKGALISYGVKEGLLGRQAARIANKILKGSSPGKIPVEQSEFYLSLNLKTAKKIGIQIPVKVMEQADFIVR